MSEATILPAPVLNVTLPGCQDERIGGVDPRLLSWIDAPNAFGKKDGDVRRFKASHA